METHKLYICNKIVKLSGFSWICRQVFPHCLDANLCVFTSL